MILAAGAHGTQRLTLCLRYWAWVLRSYLNCLEARGQTNIRAHSLHLLSCLHRSQKRKTPTLGLTRLPMELICDISKPNTPRGGAKKKKGLILFSPKFHSRTKGLVPTSIQIQVWHNPQADGPTNQLPRAQQSGWPTTNPNTNSKPHANPNPTQPLPSLLTPQLNSSPTLI